MLLNIIYSVICIIGITIASIFVLILMIIFNTRTQKDYEKEIKNIEEAKKNIDLSKEILKKKVRTWIKKLKLK